MAEAEGFAYVRGGIALREDIQKKTIDMKRILLLIAAAALLVPCAAQNKTLEKTLGDTFAFAGLETA